jgi:hypothetical protein
MTPPSRPSGAATAVHSVRGIALWNGTLDVAALMGDSLIEEPDEVVACPERRSRRAGVPAVGELKRLGRVSVVGSIPASQRCGAARQSAVYGARIPSLPGLLR